MRQEPACEMAAQPRRGGPCALGEPAGGSDPRTTPHFLCADPASVSTWPLRWCLWLGVSKTHLPLLLRHPCTCHEAHPGDTRGAWGWEVCCPTWPPIEPPPLKGRQLPPKGPNTSRGKSRELRSPGSCSRSGRRGWRQGTARKFEHVHWPPGPSPCPRLPPRKLPCPACGCRVESAGTAWPPARPAHGPLLQLCRGSLPRGPGRRGPADGVVQEGNRRSWGYRPPELDPSAVPSPGWPPWVRRCLLTLPMSKLRSRAVRFPASEHRASGSPVRGQGDI